MQGTMRGERTRRPVDAEAATERIRERIEEIRAREVERALSRLEARGGVSAAQREAVERMARSITDELVSAPESAIAEADDAERLRVALDLFGKE